MKLDPVLLHKILHWSHCNYTQEKTQTSYDSPKGSPGCCYSCPPLVCPDPTFCHLAFAVFLAFLLFTLPHTLAFKLLLPLSEMLAQMCGDLLLTLLQFLLFAYLLRTALPEPVPGVAPLPSSPSPHPPSPCSFHRFSCRAGLGRPSQLCSLALFSISWTCNSIRVYACGSASRMYL